MKPLRNLIKKSLYLINRSPYNRKLFEKTIQERASLPFSDIQGLTKHINLFSPFTYELHQPNDYYGHATTLKKFLGIDQKYQFKFVLEHGIYLDEGVGPLDLDNDFSTIITCSSYRKPVLKNHKEKVYTIGPYFLYSEPLLKEAEAKKEKKRLGSTLLFFPTHSVPGVEAKFSIEDLCKQISKYKKQFKTIRVCLYWQDVLAGAAEIYKSFGFECVTAGHVLDPNFMPRLKSILETSTITASNDIGSSIGYCIIMKKPHFILKQDLHFKGEKAQVDIVKEYHSSKTYNQIMKAFDIGLNNKITNEQKKVVDFFWGTKDLKTKKELFKIVEETEKAFDSKQFKFF